MKGVDSCVFVNASLEDGSFFKKWLIFLKPFHGLTDREMDVAAALLRKRHEMSTSIADPELLDRIVMGADIRSNIMEECGLKYKHYQIIINKMEKYGIIVDGKLNPRYVPELKEGSEDFKLLLYFSLK